MQTYKVFFKRRLQDKEDQNALRTLKISKGIDFSSNDYLGYSRSPVILQKFKAKMTGLSALGSTGSRLLNGNHSRHHEVESKIAKIFGVEAAMVFSSGYLLNLGLMQALADDETVILMDELVHNSLRNGARLSGAKVFYFRHNDLDHLEQKLKRHTGSRCLIVLESVFSMDGDVAPLEGVIQLSTVYKAEIVIDEAHGAGTFGPLGLGLVSSLSYENKILARVITFGKAFGCEGAAVLGTDQLKKYLINYCQSFIYTTGVSHPNVLMIESALDYFMETKKEVRDLHERLDLFSCLGPTPLKSPIYSWMIGNNALAKDISQEMSHRGINVFPILSPTVRRGTERIRIVLHSFNTQDEIRFLTQTMKEFR